MHQELERVVIEGSGIVLGKEVLIRLSLACLLARGHLLIEDLPGVGKTTLAHLLAKLLGLKYQRIQFTSDLLPTDILGVSIFDREKQNFRFHPGPIFSQLVLADEINRATPKAQSALLEAMEESQVTTEGESRPLPAPFFVIATQNPAHQVGTFPLPESQLDRFLLRVEIGYPHPAAERDLLAGEDRRDLMLDLHPVMTPTRLMELQQEAKKVFVAPPLLDYCQDLLAFSRSSPLFRHGLSPRAGLSLLRAARAWAFLHGRAEVIPEDLQEVVPAAVSHRLQFTTDSGAAAGRSAAEYLLRSVPVP